jgi:DNA-binding NtrC family response regulator
LHHLSSRESLHTLNLQAQEKNLEVATKLFGINQTNGTNVATVPLFKKLDQSGTLFIKNIEHLDIETQEMLAEYLTYGTYRMVKSDQKLTGNVRIICSTQQNLQTLIHDGSFSKNLYAALHKTTLACPSLAALPENEMLELIEGCAEQSIKTQTFKNLLELTDKDKAKLMAKRPESLYELRNKVQQSLVQKSKKNQIYEETQFNPAYPITDPELTEAARLGKHALRDPKIMALLWGKFKNQNQIATFLGVNRSSVNRRCKDYNLE